MGSALTDDRAIILAADRTPRSPSGMHGGGRDGQGNPRYPDWNAISDIEKEAGPRRTMVLR
jgi:hypothetical protein